MLCSDLVLLDCDDVLLDYLPGFLAFARERGFNPDPSGPGQFDLSGWLGLSRQEMLELVRDFNEGPGTGFDTLQPTPGAVEGVSALRAHGYRLRIVSSFSTNPGAMLRRQDNLDRWFGAGTFEGIDAAPIGGSKFDLLRRHEPGVFVDDLLKNALEAHSAGHAPLLLRAHHNADCFGRPAPGCPVVRVNDWEELLGQMEIDAILPNDLVDNPLPICA